MPRRVYRRTARRGRSSGGRRRVEIARTKFGQTGLGTTPLISAPLTSWSADAGILQAPPGSTIGGLRYRLYLGGPTAAANSLGVTWGFQVAPITIDDVDISPDGGEHEDWMEWGHFTSSYAIGEWKSVNGNGDDGFRTVRSMRKINSIEETLWFSLVASSSVAGMGYICMTSVTLLLP